MLRGTVRPADYGVDFNNQLAAHNASLTCVAMFKGPRSLFWLHCQAQIRPVLLPSPDLTSQAQEQYGISRVSGFGIVLFKKDD